MNQSKILGHILVVFHLLFIISYVCYILFAKISQQYINIVFLILIGIVLSSILFDGCFLTYFERYFLDDYTWKGISYESYKRFFGFDSNYEFLKYSFMFFTCLFYIVFLNRIRLHKNSIASKYFDYLLK